MSTKKIKVVILGEKNSGKTALTVRFLTGKFIHEYAKGEDLTYSRNTALSANGGNIDLQILDTSKNPLSCSINDAQGVIIVYAVDNVNSFTRAKELLSHVKAFNKQIVCIAIVANKLDLWHYRTVMRSEGEYLANKNGCMYFELSALTDMESVNRMFNVITKIINDKTSMEKCDNVLAEREIINKHTTSQRFDGRRRARSLNLPDHKEYNGSKRQVPNSQKSPIFLRRLLRSWNQSVSSMSRSKSTEKLY